MICKMLYCDQPESSNGSATECFAESPWQPFSCRADEGNTVACIGCLSVHVNDIDAAFAG